MRDDYDFSHAKPVNAVPALKRLQESVGGKERITIRLDPDILAWFRAQVAGGGNYQTLINDALRAHISDGDSAFEQTLRRIIREELHSV